MSTLSFNNSPISNNDFNFVFNIIKYMFTDWIMSVETGIYQFCKQNNFNIIKHDLTDLSFQFMCDLLNDVYHGLNNKYNPLHNELMEDFNHIRDHIYYHPVCFYKKISYMVLNIYFEFNKNRYSLYYDDNPVLPESSDIMNDDNINLPNDYFKKMNLTNDNDILLEKIKYKYYIDSVYSTTHIIIDQFKNDIINNLNECNDNCICEYNPDINPLTLTLHNLENNTSNKIN